MQDPPGGKDVPAVDGAPVVDGAPAVDGVPVVNDQPVVDYVPEVKDQPGTVIRPGVKVELAAKDQLAVVSALDPGSDLGDRASDNCGCSQKGLGEYNYGLGRLKGVEYGVKGLRYDEASIDPTPIDIASTKECFLAVGRGAIPVAMPPIGATVLYGPSAAWYMAAANRQDLVLQQSLGDLEIKTAAGSFEIVGDNKVVYASNLDIRGEGGEGYSVTTVLCMEGALRDRDKDGYADSFKLDEVTGRVAVAKVTGSSYDPLISTEYCFELKRAIDILGGYGGKSAYGVSGKRRVEVGSAFKRSSQSIAKQPGDVFPGGTSLAALDPFIQSRSGVISNVYYDWINCMSEKVASGSGSSLEVLALDCASLLI